MKSTTLARLLDLRDQKVPAVLVTRLGDGSQALVANDKVEGDLDLPASLRAPLVEALRMDRSHTVTVGDDDYFLHVFNPPLRLIVVGAVHIAQALVPMASLAGYEVSVIDPRRAFATDDRFPDIVMYTDWPDEIMEQLGPNSRTAVVTLTHDPKIDDPALEAALATDAFYIAALGSKRTHAGRIERLRERGFADSALGRIHGPAGLSLGAVSPAEIAISVMAQMTLALRKGTSR